MKRGLPGLPSSDSSSAVSSPQMYAPAPTNSVQVEVHARPQDILAEQARRVRLRESRLEARNGLAQEFAADVVVAHRGGHRVAADGHALDHRVRVVAQDIAIMAGARLGLVRIAHGVFLHRRGARHEAPLHAGGERGAAAAAQTRRLHLVDDLLARRAFAQDFLPRLIAAELAITLQRPRLLVLERLEQHQILFVSHQCPPPEPARLMSVRPGFCRWSRTSGSRETRDRPSSSERRCRRPGTPLRASGRYAHRRCFRRS